MRRSLSKKAFVPRVSRGPFRSPRCVSGHSSRTDPVPTLFWFASFDSSLRQLLPVREQSQGTWKELDEECVLATIAYKNFGVGEVSCKVDILSIKGKSYSTLIFSTNVSIASHLVSESSRPSGQEIPSVNDPRARARQQVRLRVELNSHNFLVCTCTMMTSSRSGAKETLKPADGETSTNTALPLTTTISPRPESQ